MEVTGRNSPCPCGSGKKFKKCCGNGAGVRQPQSAASDFNTLIQVGNALQAASRPADAIEYFRRAIAMDPRSVVGHYNLANALRLDGQIDAAISACDQALKLQPDLAQAHCNAGNLRIERRNGGDLEAAERHFRETLRLHPDFADAHVNYSYLLLLRGEYRSGWGEYEWRWKCRRATQRSFGFARWQGEDLRGRTILLHDEQGLGDTLQFIRYARPLARQGAHVVVECQRPLRRLLTCVDGVEQVFAEGEFPPTYDFHAPLMSLPHLLGTTLETVPCELPYIAAAPDSTASWRTRIGTGQHLNVGLVWAGNARLASPEANRVDQRRSIPLALFGGIASIEGVRVFSLQKGDGAKQAGKASTELRLIDHTAEIDDFADTAALVSALDLVVSVDTSVAHLAGAMGKPVWLLSRRDGCWRWLLDRDDSPWYPSMRIFRQESRGDWKPVVARVASELAKEAAKPRPQPTTGQVS